MHFFKLTELKLSPNMRIGQISSDHLTAFTKSVKSTVCEVMHAHGAIASDDSRSCNPWIVLLLSAKTLLLHATRTATKPCQNE